MSSWTDDTNSESSHSTSSDSSYSTSSDSSHSTSSNSSHSTSSNFSHSSKSEEEEGFETSEASEASDTSEVPSVNTRRWQEDDVKPSLEKLRKSLNAGRKVPLDEDNTTLVSISKVGKGAASLSTDGYGNCCYSPSPGELHDGRAVYASSGGGTPPQRKSFDCTACGKRLLTDLEVQEHPDLGVGICRTCHTFLFSSPYTKDLTDCSEEQCRWCGQGGRIVMCDQCDKSFCESCIVRNYGPKTLAQIIDSNWSCFCCDPELLRVPVDELKEFQKAARQVSGTSSIRLKRKCADYWAGRPTTRDVSEDSIVKVRIGDETIAELLVQEEERRKQLKLMWPNSGPVKSVARRKPKKATVRSLHPKVRHPAATTSSGAVKRDNGAVTVGEQAPARARSPALAVEVKQEPGDQPAPVSSPAPELKQMLGVMLGKQAPESSAANPATRTWIRPHQWEHKRKEAAERRRRAAEADNLKFPNSEIALENVHPNMRSNEEVGR